MAKKRRRGQRRALPVTITERAGGGVALEVAGVTQSVSLMGEGAPEGYWPLMLPDGCPRRALLLGVGGGTIATLLSWRCPGVSIVGIECDERMLAIARADFALDEVPGLTVEVADAFAWVERHAISQRGHFDLICLDLFEGGRLVAGTLATAFLRQLAALLASGGLLSVNLMLTRRTPEQLHRLRRVYEITRELRLRGNLVAHCRPLPGDQRDETAN